MDFDKNIFKSISNDHDNSILQNSIPGKMLLAMAISCIMGIVLMAWNARYLLMAIFAGILLCAIAVFLLFMIEKITITTACLIPMIGLCFVYTPLNWFTFGGLIGPTPYLSILFIIMITLTYYDKIQALLLSLYGGLMCGLIVHWSITSGNNVDTELVVNIIFAYVLTAILSVLIIEGIKRKGLVYKQHMAELSLRDDLTHLLNRRASELILSKQESAYQRKHADYAIVMMDIDNFKSINDQYGHNLGDSVLKNISELIQNSIRSEDYAFRIGGDEFLLVITNISGETSQQSCARLETSLSKIQGYVFSVTASIGCAMRSECEKPEESIELADRRMYEKKRVKN